MNLKKSLKPIRKNIVKKNTIFTTIKQVYPHLCDLTDEQILEYYHVTSTKALDRHIEHIKNILKKQAENYQEELSEIDTCFCIDSHGEFKYLYSTKKEAQQQIEHSQKTKCIKLALYPCPYHCGWHLHKI